MKDFKYSSYIAGKTDYIAGDMELIDYINHCLKDTNNYSIFIPFILCYHEIEGTPVGFF